MKRSDTNTVSNKWTAFIFGVLILCAGGGSVTASPQQDPSARQIVENQLAEVQKSFTYNGEPISPALIRDFETWLSDRGDQIIAINLSQSQTSNRYFAETSTQPSKSGQHQEIGYVYEEFFEGGDKEISHFSYIFHGTTPSGIQVLETISHVEGATGVFSILMLIKPTLKYRLDFETTPLETKPMIILEKVGEISLGDRSNPTIHLQGDLVKVTVTEFPTSETHQLEFNLTSVSHYPH